MIRRFVTRHFHGGFLYGKIATWSNRETGGLFSFWLVYWIYQRFFDHERVTRVGG